MSRATGISASSCFNLLKTLTHERLVQFNVHTKTYSLGLGLLEISSHMRKLDRAELVRPELERVGSEYGALMALWDITEERRMVLTDRVSTDAAVRIELRTGLRLPALAGAIGRCVASMLKLSPAEMRKEFNRLVWQDDTDFEQYQREVLEAEARGYAIDRGSWANGINVVGVAIADASGAPRMGIGALTLSGQLSEPRLKELGEELAGCASSFSRIWFA